MDAKICKRYGGNWNGKTKICSGIPIKQVNNMTIKWSNLNERWIVSSPDGRALEAFEMRRRGRDRAISFAKGTKDFIRS